MAKGTYNVRPKRTFPTCVCASSVAVILLTGGIVVFFAWPFLFQYILDSNLVLKDGSHTYSLWQKFPEDFHIDFYFFNWTNPEDILNKHVKPKFREMGPYRFRETKEKSNIAWNKENGTISFRHLKYWYEDTTGKFGNLNDEVTTLNPISVASVYASRDWNYLLKKGLSITLSASAPKLQVTKTVRELLFEGYTDPLLNLAKTMSFASKIPPWDRFGWFYTRNGSSDFEGVFNMGTGEKDTEFGRLYTWNYRNHTPFFEDSCGRVAGSAGEFFRSNLAKTSIEIFSPDMCRVMNLDYVGESIVDNILGYKYVMGENMLDNGTRFEENKCYCNGECVPSGAVNVSSCRYGSPAFGSLPHFFNADPYYLDSIEGLEPEQKKHEFFITLEPTTGIPLEVNARLQINLLLQSISGISLYTNVPRVFIPMLWFEQKVKIPSNEAFFLKLLLNLPAICSSIGILLIVAGIILTSCIFYKICTTNICGRKKTDRYLYPEQQVPLQIQHQTELVKLPKKA